MDKVIKVISEEKFRLMMTCLITRYGGHASNVESHSSSPGIPDIDYFLRPTTGNLELKFITRTDGAINFGGMRIRPTQVAWFKRRAAAGGDPLLMIYIKNNEQGEDVIISMHGVHVYDFNSNPFGAKVMTHITTIDKDYKWEAKIMELLASPDRLR